MVLLVWNKKRTVVIILKTENLKMKILVWKKEGIKIIFFQYDVIFMVVSMKLIEVKNLSSDRHKKG